MVAPKLEFSVDVKIPLAFGLDHRQIFERAQFIILNDIRREVQTPSRRRFVKRSGTLRRRFRGRRPYRKSMTPYSFEAIQMAYTSYTHLQEEGYQDFINLINQVGPDIVMEGLARAIQEQF